MFAKKSAFSQSLNSPKDPYFGSTILILSGDALDANTPGNNMVFDISPRDNVPFNNTYSYFFDDPGVSVVTPLYTNAFAFGLGPFTIEGFFKLTSITPNTTLLGTRATGAINLYYNSNGYISGALYNAGDIIASNFSYINSTSGYYINNPSWNHFALARGSNNQFSIWVNGTRSNTQFISNVNITATTGFTIGSGPVGYISNVRVANNDLYGVANTTIQVPTAPFANAVANAAVNFSNVTFLSCQSPIIIDTGPFKLSLTNSGPVVGANVSTGGHSIKSTGSPKVATFNPYAGDDVYSYYFDKITNCVLSLANGFNIGTNAYTFETWFMSSANLTYNSADQIMVDSTTTDGWKLSLARNYVQVDQGSNTNIKYYFSDIKNGTWNHLVVTRSNAGNTTAWLNGIRTTNNAFFSNTNYRGNTQFINSTTSTFVGYISNLKISANTSIYNPNSATITIPSSSSQKGPETALLTAKNKYLTDESNNNTTITTSSGVATVEYFSPVTSSLKHNLFSNTNQSLSLQFRHSNTDSFYINNYNFAFGTNNFTIEFWTYPTTDPSSGWTPIITMGAAAAGQELRIAQNINTTGNWGILYPDVDNATNLYISFDKLARAWNHIALTRSANTLSLYRNGVRVFANTSVGFNFSNNKLFSIGYAQVGYPDGGYNGYVNDLRIINGTALYTTNTYTVPTSPLTNQSNTVFMPRASITGHILDQAGRLTTYDNNIIYSSANTVKYGSGSIRFNSGLGSYISLPPDPKLALGRGDFTIEFWCNFNVVGGVFYSSNIGGVEIGVSSATQIYTTVDTNGGAVTWNLNQTLVTRRWYHIALCKKDEAVFLFLDGVLQSNAGTVFPSWAIGQQGAYIGRNSAGSNFDGYMDDFRITKGYARYLTTVYTPVSFSSYSTARSGSNSLQFNYQPAGEGAMIWSSERGWQLEFFVKFPSLSTTATGTNLIYDPTPASTVNQIVTYANTSSWYFSNAGYFTTAPYFFEFVPNMWYHYCEIASQYTRYLCINGKCTRLPPGTSAYFDNAYQPGNSYYGLGGFTNGTISNVRFIQGPGTYDPINGFDPPTGPLTNINTTFLQTKLLTVQDSTLKDNSIFNQTLTYSGTAPTLIQDTISLTYYNIRANNFTPPSRGSAFRTIY